MVDLIVNGLRINWAGVQSGRFYDGPASGYPAPPEPAGSGPPPVAARFDSEKKFDSNGQPLDIGTPDKVCDAARLLLAGIDFLHPAIMNCDGEAEMAFADGSTMRGQELKRLWQSARFIVNNDQNGAGRGGKTLIEARQSHIRYTTVDGYHRHGEAQLHFIILHELMHMTEACSAAWAKDWAHYLRRKEAGESPPKKGKRLKAYNEKISQLSVVYNQDQLEFRRTEQFTHLATREAMSLIGIAGFNEMHTAPPIQQTLSNMPPFGFSIESYPAQEVLSG